MYAPKVFKPAGLLCKPENNLVTFRDHSDVFSSGSSCKRIPIPNPDYIGIHATIAGILNISGARFFDEFLDKYEVPPVRSWPELEKVIEEEKCLLLSKSKYIDLFQHLAFAVGLFFSLFLQPLLHLHIPNEL